jgi:Sec20
LASLGESYAGLDSLLKSSGGLVRQLIRSNKSDTWYLTTAFYILVVTISWLVFRRILYGPLWWLVWQPMRFIWWLAVTMLTSVGIVGAQGGGVVSSSVTRIPQSTTASAAARPSWAADRPSAYVPVGAKGGGWGVQRPHEAPESDSKKEGKSLVDEIGEMAEGEDAEEQQEETVLKERSEEEGPPNPKKRMYEQERERPPQKKDEL